MTVMVMKPPAPATSIQTSMNEMPVRNGSIAYIVSNTWSNLLLIASYMILSKGWLVSESEQFLSIRRAQV